MSGFTAVHPFCTNFADATSLIVSFPAVITALSTVLRAAAQDHATNPNGTMTLSGKKTALDA